MDALIIFGWIILSFVVANMGASKNIGGLGAFLISLFFSPIIGLLVVIASSPKKKINKLIASLTKKAIKKYNQKEYLDSLKILDQALIIDPNEKQTHFNLASIYSALEQKEKAFSHLRKAVELGYNDFTKIATSDDFKWLREQAQFNSLMKNGFKPEMDQTKNYSYLDDLKKLAELKNSGIITDAEFETEKEKILKAK